MVGINDMLYVFFLLIAESLARLCRKHDRRNRHHQTQMRAASGEQSEMPLAQEPMEITNDPKRVAEWGEFHETIEGLPDDQKEIVELLWYHGLTQVAAAEVMGITHKQVRTLWRNARLELHEKLGGDAPAME